MNSLWTDTAKTESFNTLRGNTKTDILIIGGGIAGILCAYMLKKADADYILIEADKICSGITKNTTAKITSQHGFIYQKLIKEFNTDTARLYIDANQNAVKKYRELCENIDCDFEEKSSFVFSEDERKIEKELKALEKIGFTPKYVKDIPLPIKTAGAVQFEKQAQFHPLKFAYSISKGLNIFENTKVLELKPGEAITNRGKIKAEKIIVATHFPILNKHGSYFLKMYQHRSYVIALKNAPKLNGMYVDEKDDGLSFRNYKDLLLLGGGGHRTGKKGGGWKELENVAQTNLNGSSIEYKWATQDCVTLDRVPYIGKYSKNIKELYVATGFNKWGMTSSMVAAEILTDMVLEKTNLYSEIFSPCRTILRPQLAINSIESVLNLITPTAPRCPHMGCALKYNKAEHSWDCPCHGSRFTKDGQLIDNPATDDIRL